MPHHFAFDDEHKLLLVVMEGDIDGAEIVAIDEEMRARIARMQPKAGISDLSLVRNFNVPAEVMRSAALRAAPYPPETPRFIVALATCCTECRACMNSWPTVPRGNWKWCAAARKL